MRTTIKMLALASVCALACGTARAGVISSTTNFSGYGNFQGLTDGIAVDYAAFNASLGILTAASFTLTGTFDPKVDVFSIPLNSTTSITITPSIFVSPGGVAQTFAQQTVPVVNGAAAAAPVAFDYTFSLPISAYGGSLNFEANSAAPGEAEDVGTVSGTLDVAYTYDPGAPVPEPATFALLGAGLIGLGAVRWRQVKV